MHGGRHANFTHGCFDSFAVVHLYGVLRPGAGALWGKQRGLHRSLEKCTVAVRSLAARQQLMIEDIEFGQQHSGLDRIQSSIDADASVVVAAILSMIAQLKD